VRFVHNTLPSGKDTNNEEVVTKVSAQGNVKDDTINVVLLLLVKQLVVPLRKVRLTAKRKGCRNCGTGPYGNSNQGASSEKRLAVNKCRLPEM